MTKRAFKSFACDTKDEARKQLEEEVENWTWMSRKRKEEIISSAAFDQTETRFGSMFSTTVQTD